MSLFGKIQLELEINDTTHYLTFYVVEEVTTGVSLGLNWLVQTEAVLDLKNSVMRCANDTLIPLELHNLENAHVRKVSIPEEITVPPHHELLIPGAIQTPFPTEAVLEPANNMIEKGILIARVIFGPVISQIPVQIINPGSNPV